MWGGAAQIGLSYNLSSSWFIDFNYHYSISARYTNNYETSSTNINGIYTDLGVVNIRNSTRINTQSFGVTINKVF